MSSQPLHAQPAPRAWEQIFVLCLPRSGSTLLRLMLDTHPAICCPGELDLGQLCKALHHALYYTAGQASAEGADEAASAGARAIVNGFMGAYAAARGKSLWAEKTPANLDHAQMLHQIFPRGAYICLHRNLLDVLRSGWEMSRYGKLKYEMWDYKEFLEFGIRQTRALLEFERRHPDQTIRIHYERLVQSPEQELGRLFDFLKLDWEPSLVNAVFATEHAPGPGDPKASFASGLYQTSIGRGASDDVLAQLERTPKQLQSALDELLVELGYADVAAARRSAATRRAAPPAEVPPGHVNELFTQRCRTRLDPERLRRSRLRGVVKFVVKGGDGGTWTIDLDAHPPSVEAVDRDADCSITIRSEDLLKIMNGELNIGECYLQAKLRVVGDEALAVSFGRALFA